MNIIYDKMDDEDMRYCGDCNSWVNRYTDWNKDLDICRFCAENDDNYMQYIKERDAKEERADLMRDYYRDEGR